MAWFKFEAGCPPAELSAADCPNLSRNVNPCECDLPRCPDCGYTPHDVSFQLDHSVCRGAGPQWRVTGYRAAEYFEVRVAQRPCDLCSGTHGEGPDSGRACPRCQRRGYTGPEWVEGGLVLAAELAC